MYVCIYIYIDIDVYMYIYGTHTHTHTHTMQAGGAGGADAAARAVEEALVEGGRKINCGRCQLVDQGRAGRGYQYLGFWLDAGLTLDEEATPVANKLVGGGARAAAMGTRPVS